MKWKNTCFREKLRGSEEEKIIPGTLCMDLDGAMEKGCGCL